MKTTKTRKAIIKKVSKVCNPNSVIGQMLVTQAEKEAGLITENVVSYELYELIKKYRSIPNFLSGTSAGTLTSKETWLFDSILDILKIKRPYNSNIPNIGS